MPTKSPSPLTSRVINHDLRVTDNGDGTLTILFQATGNDVIYGADGKAIGRNPGQIRLEFLVDHGGTPTDPSDDVFLAEGIVKGSTGPERRLLRNRGARTELTCRCGDRPVTTNADPLLTRLSQKTKGPHLRPFLAWAVTGSNRRPPACKAGALPAELTALPV